MQNKREWIAFWKVLTIRWTVDVVAVRSAWIRCKITRSQHGISRRSMKSNVRQSGNVCSSKQQIGYGKSPLQYESDPSSPTPRLIQLIISSSEEKAFIIVLLLIWSGWKWLWSIWIKLNLKIIIMHLVGCQNVHSMRMSNECTYEKWRAMNWTFKHNIYESVSNRDVFLPTKKKKKQNEDR